MYAQMSRVEFGVESAYMPVRRNCWPISIPAGYLCRVKVQWSIVQEHLFNASGLLGSKRFTQRRESISVVAGTIYLRDQTALAD